MRTWKIKNGDYWHCQYCRTQSLYKDKLLNTQIIKVWINNYNYSIILDYKNNKSSIRKDYRGGPEPFSECKIENLPLLKVTSLDKLIDKVRTYILFS
jgi:hypothetical protein